MFRLCIPYLRKEGVECPVIFKIIQTRYPKGSKLVKAGFGLVKPVF